MIFNGLGFVMVVLGGILAAGLAWATGHYESTLMWFWGSLLVVLDLTFRLRADRKLFHPIGGGWVFLIPIWCVGLILLILETISPHWRN